MIAFTMLRIDNQSEVSCSYTFLFIHYISLLSQIGTDMFSECINFRHSIVETGMITVCQVMTTELHYERYVSKPYGPVSVSNGK